MTARFADTFFFFALGNPDDPAHEKARGFAADKTGPLVTTAWVLTELADGLSAPSNRPAFLRLLRSLQNNTAFEIVPPDLDLFEHGIDLFSRRPDKAWSLTDCISFVVMTDRGLTEALTGDHHFEQAGFHALLRQG
jgi:predicted nucleic acid-binding protein